MYCLITDISRYPPTEGSRIEIEQAPTNLLKKYFTFIMLLFIGL